MTITDTDVAAAHPDLPGLRILLDPVRLAEACAELGTETSYVLDRLRIKPGASVTAMLRPAHGPDQRWVLARALAPTPWQTKRGKDVLAARRRHLPHAELAEARLLLCAAAADRRLPGLARLRPDTGAARIKVPPQHTREPAVVRTLSHNPARRWVGSVTPAGHSPRLVLRLHRDAPAQVMPWHPGRRWRPGDPLPGLVTGTDPARPAQCGEPNEPVDLAGALNAAVAGLGALHPGLGCRAASLAKRTCTGLGSISYAWAHGDLTRDQVVIGDDGMHVLDWDRAGLWPLGWDAATWVAGLVAEGIAPDRMPAVDDAVMAAAAILRAPEPFRRRRPNWARRTEDLLDLAQQCLS